MEFLEGIELGSTRRSRRVRSWYLYEQYKALERNQLEAARQLNYKTSQDKLLYRELSEHRQRRKICSECHSEPGVHYIRNGSTSSRLSMSINDIFESLCDQDDEFRDSDASAKESYLWSQTISEPFDNINEDKQKDCLFDPDAIPVPHLNLDDADFLLAASSGNLADDVKEELEFVKRSIDENIHLQLEMKADVQFLEEYAKPPEFPESKFAEKLEKFDKSFEVEESKYATNIEDISDEDSICSQRPSYMSEKVDSKSNINALWTKLVSFAYQVVQLNHGNCYYDYSSQLLTAVLACDILRRGIGRMCNVLQPYVSPVKCVSNSCMTTTSTSNYNNAAISDKKERSKKNTPAPSDVTKKPRRCLGVKYQGKHIQYHNHNKLNSKSLSAHGERTCCSRIERQCLPDKSTTKSSLESEIWHSISNTSITLPSKYSSAEWREHASYSTELNSYRTQVTNPMLKLAKYIDSIVVQDCDEL